MRSLILLSIFTFLFTHCNNNPLTDRTSKREIQGYITDEFSGLAIDSVKVRLQSTDYEAFTDSTGFYSFKDMSYDKYRIIVDKDEYKTSDSLVEYYSSGTKTVNLEISKNKLLATTDSINYTAENNRIEYSILNNLTYSTFYSNCCGQIIFAVVKENNSNWIFSEWVNFFCYAICPGSPREILPDSTYTSYLRLKEAGTYKIAILYGYNPEYTMTDTVFTNVFTVTNE